MAATSSDGSEGESERFGHQQESPDTERAGDDLLGGEHFAEAGAGDGAEGEGGFVVEGEGDVGVLHQDVVAQDGGVAQVFEDGDVDLAILLEPGVAGELKEGEQRERHADGSGRERLHFAGVFSNCCLVQTRLGLSSSDLAKACARFGVAILFAQAEAQPEVGFGIGGIEFDGLLKIGDGELGAAAQLGRDVVIADAARHVHHGGLGRLLDGLVDGVLGLGAVGEAAHDVGDGLAVEGAEQAIVLGVGGLQRDGFFGELDALLGDLAAGLAVAQFDGDFGEITIGQGGVVLGLRVVGRFGGGGVGLRGHSVRAARSCLSRAISRGEGAAAAMKAAMKIASMIYSSIKSESGDPPLHREEIHCYRHQDESIHGEHEGGRKQWDEPAGQQVSHGHAAAEGKVVDAHHAAAHFVGGDELHQGIDQGEDRDQGCPGDKQHEAAQPDRGGEGKAADARRPGRSA